MKQHIFALTIALSATAAFAGEGYTDASFAGERWEDAAVGYGKRMEVAAVRDAKPMTLDSTLMAMLGIPKLYGDFFARQVQQVMQVASIAR